MATDGEIMKLWSSFGGKKGDAGAIICLYRQAEKEGRQAGISGMEKEMLSDATIEAAMQNFGRGHNKGTAITVRAVLREAIHIAKQNAGK